MLKYGNLKVTNQETPLPLLLFAHMSTKLSLKPSYWVIVPAFNEERYLASVLEKIRKYTTQIVVVDDGSHDQTSAIAQNYTPYVLRHPVNLGKGGALKTGCDFAFASQSAHGVILIDSDDQHDPDELSLFQEQLEAGAEIVFGVRRLNKNMPLIKRLGNIFISLSIYCLFGKYFSDVLSGYKAMTKQAYDLIRWDSTDYAVELEIAVRVAKSNLKRSALVVKTIYHDHDRGMTLLDAIHFITLLLNWRVSL